MLFTSLTSLDSRHIKVKKNQKKIRVGQLTDHEVTQLNEVDRLLLRQVLNAPSSCPSEALYLELGCKPISIVIKSLRINYLHHLVTRKYDEMLFKFVLIQWKYQGRKITG